MFGRLVVKRFRDWGVIAAMMVVLAAPTIRLGAQTVTGTILGNVLDASGAAISNAQIIITNQDTSVIRTTVSTADGVYDVPSLLPGRYTVEARAQGFSPIQIKDVVLSVGSDSRVDLKLQVSSTTQTVTVTEAVPTVETMSSEVSQVMNQDLINDVPLNARDLQQLAVIQPGVQYDYYNSYGKQLSVIGDRPTHNRYVQEGMDLTWTYRTGPDSLPTPDGVILGVEAVKEFKVISTDSSAEYGDVSGGTISTLFKSGTNEFHGSAYEYYRNSAFDARNFFDKTTSAPPFQRHQFGAALGGPIKKDNTFFFVNYEGYRSDLSQSFVADEPDAASRESAAPVIQQIFFGGTGGSGPNPILPVCNGSELGQGLCQFFSNPVQTIHENYGVVKIDHSFGQKNTLSSTYNNDETAEYAPAPTNATADDQYVHRQTYTLQDTHIVSPNLVNTARFGINRVYYNYELDLIGDTSRYLPDLFVPSDPYLGKSPYPVVPVISVGGGFQTFGVGATGQAYAPRWIGYTAGLLSDDVNYLHGKHALQFGVQAKKWDDNVESRSSQSRGSYSFQNLTQFLAGGPAQSFLWTIEPADLSRSWRMHSIAFYGEDTYKAKPNLTLTYGLRWEYVPGPGEANGLISTIYNPTPETSPGPVVGGPYYSPSAHNFAPRLGVNWDPFKKGTTSVRAGAGIFYNEIEDDFFYAGGFTNPPFSTTVSLANEMTLPFSQSILNSALAGGAKQTFAAAIPPDPHTPTKYGYNVSFQQELPDHMSFMAAFVGAQSRWLGRSVNWQDYNPTGVETPGQVPTFNGQPITYNGVPAPINPNCTAAGEIACLYWAGVGVQNANVLGTSGPSSAYATLCNPGATPAITKNCYVNNNFGNSVGATVYDADASYNSLQIALERRMSPGLYARFNYTLAKCITDADDDLSGGSTNGGSSGEIVDRIYNSSRGRCSYMGTNAVNFTLTYDSPFGRIVHSQFAKALLSDWQISSLTTVSSGTPFNITDGLNISRSNPSGAGLDRPDWAPGCNAQNAITNPHNSSNTYVNASCFEPAVAGYEGDVGALILTGPALWDTDVSLKRRFSLGREGRTLTLGADMFNAFNRTNFSDPLGTTVFVNSGTTTSPDATPNKTAGQIVSTVTTSRQFQISGRFTF